jgi:hypothetical protein
MLFGNGCFCTCLFIKCSCHWLHIHFRLKMIPNFERREADFFFHQTFGGGGGGGVSIWMDEE